MGSCVSVHSDNDNKSDSGSSCWQLRGSHGSKRMKGSSFSSQQIINLQHHLPSLPNRIFNNGKSRTSCIFSQQGKKGINQDAMVVWEDFACDDAIFCGVFDGHGPHGHLVARKVRDVLPLKLLSSLQFHELRNRDSGNCFKRKESVGMGDSLAFGEENQFENPLMPLWRNVFLDSFKAMDKELRSHPSVDCFCSGSTAVTLIKQGLNLFIGNIGDSRAVLGSRGNNDSVVAVQLTVDLKPDLPVEAERIKRCKGRVFALQDEPEVQRVWLPFDDAPGLAMARAFGDFCLKDYGVISIPEFSHRILTEADQFVVMASDGIWDVLSNQEVVEIVLSAPNRSSAARVLVNSAVREWKLKYPTSKIDDCAVVCLYLDGKVDSESEAEEPQSISSATHNSCHSLCQVNECEGDGDDDDEAQIPEPCLQRNFTVRSAEDSDYPNSRTSAVPCGDGEPSVVTEDQKWSGLEGVTRVNSLVQLPRFSGELPSA